MKRQIFYIDHAEGCVIKHKWNSARREVVHVVRDIAKREGATYECTASASHKPDGETGFVMGFMEWTGDNGKVRRFDIAREDYRREPEMVAK